MQPDINRVVLSTIISFLVLITMAKRRNQSGQMIKQPLAVFSVMPCATEEDMETAMFVGATLDIGYCEAVIIEGTNIQYCNTPLWSQILLFFAAQVGTEPFQAVLVEISGEPSFCKTGSCKMLRDVEAEPSTVLPMHCTRAVSSIS